MLPYPVSANRYWRSFRGRMVVSAEAVNYKSHVGLLWHRAGGIKHDSIPVAVFIKLHPKTTKKGTASKTRMDLDNAIKVTLDALNGMAWADDKQVFKIDAEICHPIDGGAVAVRVVPTRLGVI